MVVHGVVSALGRWRSGGQEFKASLHDLSQVVKEEKAVPSPILCVVQGLRMF